MESYYEQCRLIDPTRESNIPANIKEKLLTDCGFDSYLEDEESIETHEKLKSLTVGKLHINVKNYYKGFGIRDEDGNFTP